MTINSVNIHSKHYGCRLCKSTLLKCIIPLLPVPIGEHYSEDPCDDAQRYPIDIYQCLSCGAVQTNDDIDPEFLWKDYTYFSGHTKKIINHFDAFANNALKKIKKSKIHVLDIGSNDGSLLKSFRNLGCVVKGVDPAPSVVSEALASGIDTELGLFTYDLASQLNEKNGNFDIITAFNVFAHSQDMESMLEGVKLLLSRDGIFAFEVQYLVDIQQKNLLGTFFHEHMIHYSLNCAKYFLNSCQLDIFDYERNNIQNGSIIIYACHSDQVPSHDIEGIRKVFDQIQYENSLGLGDAIWGIQFTNAIYETRSQVKAFLQDHNDFSLVAYGAARSGPTLLIQYGLDGHITKLYDNHPSKVNKFSPYMGLKVYPTSELNPEHSPFCVILAYIHYQPILKDNFAYIESGGSFILLWPEFAVINNANYSDYIHA